MQGKMSVGLWVPLRRRKQDIRQPKTGGSNTPDEPKGTVADFHKWGLLKVLRLFYIHREVPVSRKPRPQDNRGTQRSPEGMGGRKSKPVSWLGRQYDFLKITL